MQTTATVLSIARTPDADVEQAAEEAVKLFISQNNLTFRPATSESGYVGPRAFAAFGICQVDRENGWAVRVMARESRYRDGLDLEIKPLFMLFGEEWEWVPALRNGAQGFSDFHQWTTSSIAKLRGLGGSYDPSYLQAVAVTFDAARARRSAELAAEQLAESLRTQYACDSNGKTDLATGGVCRIGHSGASAYASFQFSLSDPAQIAAVMAIVNGPVTTPSAAAPVVPAVRHLKAS